MALIKCPACSKEISKNAESCPGCGEPNKYRKPQPQKKKSGSSLGGLLVLGILVWVYFIVTDDSGGTSAGSTTAGTSAPSRADRERIAIQNLKLDYTWEKYANDALMRANFTFTNGNDFPIKDIEVRCNHVAKSGTKIDSNTRTIYETIGPGETKQFKNFEMGFIHDQVDKTGCAVKSLAF
tara:strand:- start:7435 stop:7977 length:543 start_codon:yes stop_codon:yes gene_type:complete